MNKRINYRWYANYMENQYSEELDSIVTDGTYDFEDWIRDSNFAVERDGDCYYILDGCDERTGEMYQVISEEDTEEDLRGWYGILHKFSIGNLYRAYTWQSNKFVIYYNHR